MDTSSRQAFLAAVEEEARDPTYWIGELGEFAMFDVCAAYLTGDARLAIDRSIEHIETLLQGRKAQLKSIEQLVESDSLAPHIKSMLVQLAAHRSTSVRTTEADAQNAVRSFYFVLFGHDEG